MGFEAPISEVMLVSIRDLLAARFVEKPTLIAELLWGKHEQKERPDGFASGEDFKKAWEAAK